MSSKIGSEEMERFAMSFYADLLLDVACSAEVQGAVQAVFPGVRLHASDIEKIAREDRLTLSGAHAIVLGLRNQNGELSLDLIEKLRIIAPHIGIFVIEKRSKTVDPWLRRLALSGADDAFALDRPGEEKVLGSVLANRVTLPPPERAIRRLWFHWADCPVRVEAIHCVRNAYRSRQGFVPNEWFGLKDRVMRDHFHRALAPTPFFLTRYGLDLHWSEGLLRGQVSRTRLATLLGFETVTQVSKERRRMRRAAARWPELSALLE
jgi:hypothetical protein